MTVNTPWKRILLIGGSGSLLIQGIGILFVPVQYGWMYTVGGLVILAVTLTGIWEVRKLSRKE